MSQALATALRDLAQRISDGRASSRIEATAEFWDLAGQLRAALPPMLLPHRAAPATRRIGYLVTDGVQLLQCMSELKIEHDQDDVWLFGFGLANGLPAAEWARCIDLDGSGEAQAARTIASVDLDVLIDLGGAALDKLPLLVALHPARIVVEPLFAPWGRDVEGSSARLVDPPKDLPLSFLAQSVRSAADRAIAGLETLPVAAGELNALLERAVSLHRQGNLESARAAYELVLARYPAHPSAAYLLGQLLHQQGDTPASIQWLQRATESAPGFRDAQYTLGQRLADRQQWADAADAYRSAVELTPDFAAAWAGLGLATEQQSDKFGGSGIQYLQRSVALEPSKSQWQFNLGAALQRRADLAGARAAYQQALSLSPDHVDALFNLGAVTQDESEYRAAAAIYQTVLRKQPGFAAAYAQLGVCLQLSNQVDAWLENLERYRASCSVSLSMAVYGLEASMAAGDVAAHEAWRDRILGGGFPAEDEADYIRNWEQLLFLLLHVDLDRTALAQWYRRYDAAASSWYGAPVMLSKSRTAGRIRVGYLSGDLRDHVMGHMIYEWVSRHDRTSFDVKLYSLSPIRDVHTQRFEQLGLSIIDLSSKPHSLAALRIREDELDLLIDCSGHTRGARPGILALKPARVIATHIATPGPVGLHAIDYKLTEPLAESDDAQKFVIERLFPVPAGVFPWRTHAGRDDRNLPPTGISRGRFVCGAFVSLMKLSPRCLDLWRAVLERLPQATLALSPTHVSWQPAYLRWLEARGISRRRVQFIARPGDEAGQLARYRLLDVALDPVPCGNVNGTMEALTMGVPVVTLVGERHGERLGLTLLSRFGTPETIAYSNEDYVATVARLAEDADWAAELKRRIVSLHRTSPVWDTAAQVLGVESAYRQMLAGTKA